MTYRPPYSRGSAYQAKRVTIDGITFASGKEGRRYSELKMLLDAGEISDLRRQVPFALHAPRAGGGEPVLIGKYLADFVYFDKELGAEVVEDPKGFRTDLYSWKKKHVEAEYGIQIIET